MYLSRFAFFIAPNYTKFLFCIFLRPKTEVSGERKPRACEGNPAGERWRFFLSGKPCVQAVTHIPSGLPESVSPPQSANKTKKPRQAGTETARSPRSDTLLTPEAPARQRKKKTCKASLKNKEATPHRETHPRLRPLPSRTV